MENRVKKYLRNLNNKYPFTSEYGQIFQFREQEIRMEFTQAEVIFLLENQYQQQYFPNDNFDAYDQLLACESVAEATQVSENYVNKFNQPSESVSVSESSNDTDKQTVEFELTPDKLQIISQLRAKNYKSSPTEVASLLEQLFRHCNSKPGHWLYIAQHWPPRPIIRVINRIIALHTSGRITLKNPAAYFTRLIKFRKRRKSI